MNFVKPLLAALAVTLLLAGSSSAQLIKAVGDFQPRFKPGSGGNGLTDASNAVLDLGVHSIAYTGTIADFTAGNVDNARPFIGFDQSIDGINGPEDIVANFAYIDNILLTVGGNTIWSEDFEGATIGETNPTNGALPGTVVQGANLLQLEAVSAPAEFTTGSGQAALLSTTGQGDPLAGNRFAALRTAGAGENNFISFASVPDTTAYSLTFELYIPEAGTTSLLGDFDNNDVVDLADLDQYSGNIGKTIADNAELAALDLDDNGTIEAADLTQHYTDLVGTSNGQTGTFAGDADLNGVVDVLGDAAALINNLGVAATSWSQGDFNADGAVDVLSDAAALINNLGNTNNPPAGAPATAAVPEPGCLTLLALTGVGAAIRRRR